MKAKSAWRFARIAPRKVRYVADLVRGKPVGESLNLLRFTPKVAARMLDKVIRSAVANAANQSASDVDSLWIAEIRIDEGPTLRRFRARALGSAGRIRRRTSHLHVVVTDEVQGKSTRKSGKQQ